MAYEKPTSFRVDYYYRRIAILTDEQRRLVKPKEFRTPIL